MPGIADVAAHAGVSKATASRALSGGGYVSEATRARVRSSAAQLGYVPSTSAVSLATGRTKTVGVVMPYLNRWFFAEVLEGIQQRLLAEGWDLTLYDARPGTEGRARIFDDFLARQRFDGLLTVGLEPGDGERAVLARIGRPIVSIVGFDSATTAVAIDDDLAARRATEHLLTLGHRDIVFLGGGEGRHWTSLDRRRLRGYRQAMIDAGLESQIRHVESEITLPGGYAAAVELLAPPAEPVTGVVGICDEVAIGAIIAARRLGIPIPSALSVIGIDDHEFAEMFSLTTVRQVPREQGAAAVEALLAEIGDPARAGTVVTLPARMVVRSSTARVP